MGSENLAGTFRTWLCELRNIFDGRFNFSQPHEMATTLGKRKRAVAETSKNDRRQQREDSSSSELDAQEIFRRHFEAQFKPLPVSMKAVKVIKEAPEDDSEEESDWDGISDIEETAVQVVEHTEAQSRMATMSREELKAFMVHPPIPLHTTSTKFQSELQTPPNYTHCVSDSR